MTTINVSGYSISGYLSFISDFSFNSISVTYNFIWINDYEYREPLLSWDYSRDLGQQWLDKGSSLQIS